MKSVKDAILIMVAAIIIGFAVNIVRNATSTGGLPLNTPWPDNRQKVELEFPPSYEAGTDSVITLEDAYNMFLADDVVFIDAREQEEFDEGHIKGALNLPFEWWDDYWENVRPRIRHENRIVVYCGGLDCELSLFGARELKRLGYEKAYVFFGGWQRWVEAGLPMETTEHVDD